MPNRISRIINIIKGGPAEKVGLLAGDRIISADSQQLAGQKIAIEECIKYLKGEKTSTNPVALIFAWTGALAKRGELDKTPELVDFARKLEKATLSTIESGKMTGDLARISTSSEKTILDSWEFIDAIASQL